MSTSALTGRERGRGRAVVQAGLVLLWVSALLSVPIGDCGGSPEACAAAETVVRDQVRLLVVVLLAVTVIGFGALRTAHPLANAALLVSSATLALLGLWAIAATSETPSWLPSGFMFAVPATLVLVAGAAIRFLSSRDIRER